MVFLGGSFFYECTRLTLQEILRQLHFWEEVPFLNDGAKRNRLLYLKIMYTQVRKILCLQEILRQLHFWEKVFF